MAKDGGGEMEANQLKGTLALEKNTPSLVSKRMTVG